VAALGKKAVPWGGGIQTEIGVGALLNDKRFEVDRRMHTSLLDGRKIVFSKDTEGSASSTKVRSHSARTSVPQPRLRVSPCVVKYPMEVVCKVFLFWRACNTDVTVGLPD
jgi:hypothetical protein